MKRIYIFMLILALGVPGAFSYSPPVDPDLKYLPAVLDSTLSYRWDSDSGLYLFDSRRFFHDDNGNLMTAEVNNSCFSFFGHHYDGNHRFSFSYDAEGQRIKNLAECYDSEANNWLAELKEEWSYDENGNLVESRRYSWSGNNDWAGVNKINLSYDEDGNKIEEIWYVAGIHDWIESGKSKWKYDENGNQIESIYYDWGPVIKEWVLRTKENCLYDENGNMLEEINYYWDADILHWINEKRYLNACDENGNRIERIDYSWDSDIRDWVGNWKYNWTYDENGNQIELISYEWDPATKDWVKNRMENYLYDEYGNQLEYIEYDWYSDINNWAWTEGRRTEYTYDKNGNLTECIEYYKDSSKSDWIVSSAFYAYWSELNTSIPAGMEELQCLIYPNPVKDHLIIETTSSKKYLLTIHAQNGQLISYKASKDPSLRIDLSAFNSGVYFVTIRSRDSVVTRKIVKL